MALDYVAPTAALASTISTPVYLLALACFVLYLVILFVAHSGFLEIILSFNKPKQLPRNVDLANLEGVTILRPLKGIDPELETCLESSLLQYYPRDKLEVLFCVEDPSDPVIPVVNNLLQKYPSTNARLLVGSKDHPDHYGPNPKINNLAKGFVAAQNDIIWVMDSNVWACRGALLRSVLALNNSLDNSRQTWDPVTGKGKPVKVVHHLPLAVALKNGPGFVNNSSNGKNLGCKLDETFLKTSHAKFYVAFNKLAVAPCVNGKSNIYRRSDIDKAVAKIGQLSLPSNNGQSGNLAQDAAYYGSRKGYGIRYFSKFIGEDNMIAIALWNIGGRTGMTGDCVLQPLGTSAATPTSPRHTSIQNNGLWEYVLRRLRWLRVRRYMVLAATLLEPATESIVASLYGTFAVSVLFLNKKFSLTYMFCHFAIWFCVDYVQFHVLLKYAGQEDSALDHIDNIEQSHIQTQQQQQKYIRPYFASPYYNGFSDVASNNDQLQNSWPNSSNSNNVRALPLNGGSIYRNLKQWSLYWALRELLALPIWIYAMIGTTIDWRGRPFIIKSDLTAEEI